MLRTILIALSAVIVVAITTLVVIREFQSKLPSTGGKGPSGAPSVEGPFGAPPGER